KHNDACVGSCDVNDCSSSGSPTSGPAPNTQVGCYRADGLFCDSSSTCQPLADAGQPCAFEETCKLGLYCNDGLCAPAQADGASCASNDECAGGACIFSGAGTVGSEGICGKDTLASASTCGGEL
ncbi:MAG TPA: hypothetical protein VHV51_17415, partial [Polyangiaceae bacterium]|nr:hypothetical protein [Polyangiaceae bacterium]